jgi:hypothetical protein
MLNSFITDTNINWHQLLNDLPINAYEAMISTNFVRPLLAEFGFKQQEI